MRTEQTDVVVIGAGIVGLAVAERFSRNREVVVCERHPRFGFEASSRNSQVIHAGIYYPAGSLKARLCVEGSAMMYEFCQANGVAAKRVGKIIPGNTDAEIEQVGKLYELGRENGAVGLRMLSAAERRDLSPELRCVEALSSPGTGIVDAHGVMARLEHLAASRGTVFAYGVEVMRIERNRREWRTIAIDSDGTEVAVESEIVVNAAGMGADALAASAGIDLDEADYRQTPCKGEYFRVHESKKGRTAKLIYPADTATDRGTVASGVHLVQELDGSMKIGPNAMFGQNDLDVDKRHATAFYSRMAQFLPWLDRGDLRPDTAGVRAMRFGEEDGIRDYVIADESQRGMPGLINCIGMESPALTSCLAIAKYIVTT